MIDARRRHTVRTVSQLAQDSPPLSGECLVLGIVLKPGLVVAITEDGPEILTAATDEEAFLPAAATLAGVAL